MKAYFDKYATLTVEAENDAERAALLLWSEKNASSDWPDEKAFNGVVDHVGGLLLMAGGETIFDKSQKLYIDGNANSNAVSVTKSAKG